MSAASASRCTACGAPLPQAALFAGRDRLHGARGEHEVRQCATCGTGVTFPIVAPEGLAGFYPDEYGPYEEPAGWIAGTVSRAIRAAQVRLAFRSSPLRAARSLAPGRMVDVGCGRGDLAAAFVSRGWAATGVEPSAAACSVARRRGVDARQGTLADVPLEPGTYDAAVFRHSLEHTTDPVGDLAAVRDALRPGGLVMITVPNFSSWQRRRFRDRWYHLDLPRHRTHFTPSGLRAAVGRAGLEPVELTTSSSTVGLPASVQYALTGRCLFPGGMPLRVASGLCALALPLTRLLDAAAGAGDQLHAVVRKPLASRA